MKRGNRNPEITQRIRKTARICGVSDRSVQRVIIGVQKNEQVLSVFMNLQELETEAFEMAKENYLLDEVERVVPFN